MAAVIGRSQLARLLEGWVAGEGALHTRLTGRLRALVWAGELLPALACRPNGSWLTR